MYDDSERTKAEHKMLVRIFHKKKLKKYIYYSFSHQVGSLNAGAKYTVTKGLMEKISGLVITKNLAATEAWEMKVLAGRLVWLLMSPASHHFDENIEDNYDSMADYVRAMRTTDMPRYMMMVMMVMAVMMDLTVMIMTMMMVIQVNVMNDEGDENYGRKNYEGNEGDEGVESDDYDDDDDSDGDNDFIYFPIGTSWQDSPGGSYPPVLSSSRPTRSGTRKAV